jgi:hypothetical protein
LTSTFGTGSTISIVRSRAPRNNTFQSERALRIGRPPFDLARSNRAPATPNYLVRSIEIVAAVEPTARHLLKSGAFIDD